MKMRYDAYYRSISNTGQPALAAGARPRLRSAPEPVMRQRSVLEAIHPEIVQAVILLWGYPEMNVYLEKLWLADGTQSPIAPEAMSELMLLAGVHRHLSPQHPTRNMASIYDVSTTAGQRRDRWDNVPRRR